MNVVFAGQTGINKQKVLENLARAIGGFCGDGKQPQELEKEKLLKVYEAESVFDSAPYGLISWLEEENPRVQEKRWVDEVTRLVQIIEDEKNKNNFLSLHAVYRKYREYISPVTLGLLAEFKPDLIVTLIDDVYDISWRLKQNQAETLGENFNLGEIIEWRAIEVMVMDRLSRDLAPPGRRIPHYVVAIKHPSRMLAKLILFPEQLRLYTAYPITGLRGGGDEKENLRTMDNYRAYMHENFVVFDPNTIDEFWLHRLTTQRVEDLREGKVKSDDEPFELDMGQIRWPMRSKELDFPQLSEGISAPKKLQISARELEDVAESAKQQIATRDYRLISQSNAMAAFRPLYKGNASTGVIRELGYAKLSHKRAYQYWNEEEDDGNPANHPFLSKGIFTSDKEEWHKWLYTHQEELQGFPEDHAHGGNFHEC